MKLEDVKDKLKPGFRFTSKPTKWLYRWEVVRIVDRGVVAQMYGPDWKTACRGHQRLVEWSEPITEV